MGDRAGMVLPVNHAALKGGACDEVTSLQVLPNRAGWADQDITKEVNRCLGCT